MEYYHIQLSTGTKRFYTIVLPWEKHNYQKLPMGVCNRPNIFHGNITKLFQGFNIKFAYLYNVIVIT